MEQYYLLEGDYVYASKTIGVSSGYGWQVTEQEKDLWQTIKLLGDLLYLEVGVGAGIGLKANIFEGIEAGIVAKYAVVTGYDKDFFLNFENVAEGSIGNWIIELTGSTGVVTDLITGEKFDVTDADLNLGELETLWTTNKEITDDRFEILGVEAYVILGLEFEFGFNKDVMEELVGYDRE